MDISKIEKYADSAYKYKKCRSFTNNEKEVLKKYKFHPEFNSIQGPKLTFS